MHHFLPSNSIDYIIPPGTSDRLICCDRLTL
uniref:Uncharacterized protein n=1 Tax=Rhizophora mucronata TaxID=61149 RepID=A0A2P2NAL2_RHIMU